MSPISDHTGLNILFLPAKSKYLSEINPIAGIFIKEQAKAASLYNDIVVLYAYPNPVSKPEGFWQISEDIEEGIRTIRVKYRKIPAYLKRLVLRNGKTKQPLVSSASNKFTGAPKKKLRERWMMGDSLLYHVSLLAAFRRLVKEGWKPDIIHAHYASAGLPAVVLGKLYGIPVIITEHRPDFSWETRTFFDRMKFRFTIKRVSMILAVSIKENC